MGQEISSAAFTKQDFEEFYHRLEQETEFLKELFKQHVFERDYSCCGFELEGWLIDKEAKPAPVCLDFLDNIDDPHVVPELSLFNFEYNSPPHEINQNLLADLHKQLSGFMTKAEQSAKKMQCDAVTIGILPTLQQKMLARKNFHPNERYRALDQQLKKLRQGEHIDIHVKGKEDLHINHSNVLIETVSTSLQIHLQMNASKAVRYYNASHIISAPMVAIAANSPFLFGKSIWEETRIPVFENVVALSGKHVEQKFAKRRVTLGNDYVKDSIFDLYLENLKYGILMPELMDTSVESLSHLRFHNGTIWRWNRPLIDFNKEGTPHIRIEHRVTAAGPSAVDNIANIALFLGLMRYYAYCREAPETHISFRQAKENFYQAAQYGLLAKIVWLDNQELLLKDLILECLIPQAKKGLSKLGIDPQDIKFYLDIISTRVRTLQTGSAWQQQFIEKYGVDFTNLMKHYVQQQQQDIPVSQWKV